MCLCLPFTNHERSALSSATKSNLKKSDEKERLRKKIGELDGSFWFLDRMRYWFVDRKRSLLFPFRFCSSFIAHARAKRRSNELNLRFTRASDGSFGRRLQALRDAASVSFLSKGIRPFSIAAKRRNCIHVWRRNANRFRALSWLLPFRFLL